jgi:hypothetical protein
MEAEGWQLHRLPSIYADSVWVVTKMTKYYAREWRFCYSDFVSLPVALSETQDELRPFDPPVRKTQVSACPGFLNLTSSVTRDYW